MGCEKEEDMSPWSVERKTVEQKLPRILLQTQAPCPDRIPGLFAHH